MAKSHRQSFRCNGLFYLFADRGWEKVIADRTRGDGVTSGRITPSSCVQSSSPVRRSWILPKLKPRNQ